MPLYNPTSGSSLTLIEEWTAGAPTASKTFSAIPGTYNGLKLVMSVVGTDASTQNIQARLNGDTGANYNYQALLGFNTTASASASATSTFLFLGGASATGSLFPGQASIDFVNYASTVHYKACVGTGYYNITTAIADGRVRTLGGTWRNTAAVTSLEVFLGVGNLATDSHIALYGY